MKLLPLLFHHDLMMVMITVMISISQWTVVDAQIPIPARYDGFVYGKDGGPDWIQVEAFFDPLCPDSSASWPPLKQAIRFYAHHHYNVSLIVHTFSLPYHDNSFVASRALHIANGLDKSTTYPLLELFFKHQEKFYNKPTRRMSRASIVAHIEKFVAKAVGNSSLSAIISGFKDEETDLATRISFKHGCSRAVIGTPYFFVNGIPLYDSGSDYDYKKWRSTIDPLLGLNKKAAQRD